MDGQEEYVRQVLEAYRKTPGTMGTVRRADRLLAAQLYERGISAERDRKCIRAGGDAAPDASCRMLRRWARFARWPISFL